MADHYYTQVPSSDHKPGHIFYEYRGERLQLQTDSGVFSRREIDQGSDLLLRALPDPMRGQVLDLGCGYGVIGLSVGKRYPACRVLLADINQRACQLALENAKTNGVTVRVLESDGYAQLPPEQYDWILQNPPIRAGKAVIYPMFAQGAKRLRPDGSLWIVIRKQQGAASAMAYLQEIFTKVEAVAKKGGYWVLQCTQPLESTQGEKT